MGRKNSAPCVYIENVERIHYNENRNKVEKEKNGLNWDFGGHIMLAAVKGVVQGNTVIIEGDDCSGQAFL